MIASAKPRTSITSAEHDVHDADALVVGRRDVLVPQIGPPALAPDPDRNRRRAPQDHDDRGDQRDRLVERDRVPGQLAEQAHAPPAPARAGCAAAARTGLRVPVGDDGVEQARRDGAVGHRLHIAAGLRRAARKRGRRAPSLHRARLAPRPRTAAAAPTWTLNSMPGKAVAAEMRRQPVIDALPVGLQVQPRRHPRHGVDHRPICGTKKLFQTVAEVSRKLTGVPGGNDQLIDGGDALIGVDEQPFPIERDDFDVERRHWRT